MLKPAPGTWGSLFGVLIWWLLLANLSWWWQLLVIVLVVAVGVAATRWAVAGRDDADPGAIVIDEIAGVWIALLAIPQSIVAVALGFGLFRLFDILKPGPIGWADRNVKGAWGVMLDDLLAGGLALLVLHITLYALDALGLTLPK